jgi:hypothetical protein
MLKLELYTNNEKAVVKVRLNQKQRAFSSCVLYYGIFFLSKNLFVKIRFACQENFVNKLYFSNLTCSPIRLKEMLYVG